jgi:membrane fusion protein, copper/silver efflux system
MNALWKKLKPWRHLVLLVAVVGAFVIGFHARGPVADGPKKRKVSKAPEAEVKTEVWTCSMHPEIRMPGPGRCPKCPMDLIKLDEGDGGGTGRTLKLGAHARKLAEIAVARVERRALKSDLRLVGKVGFDETRVGYITAWVAGRIDKLYVDFTGVTVKRWQPMANLYSPELVTAQMELITAARLASSLQRSGVSGASTLRAARDKLRLLGLSATQIAAVEKRGRPSDHQIIYTRRRGVVVKKHAQVGMYVKAGTRLFTVADLRRVWVLLDVYESDLHRVRKGQTVTFEAKAYPGERFTGKVAFIDPFVTDRTRTIRVRVEVDNKHKRLKPDMLVSAVIGAGHAGAMVAEGGHKGGHEGGHQGGHEGGRDPHPLVIPATAPLLTGTRAVVYVEKQPGTYEGRVVVLGSRVGDYYVVRQGLREGEKVVTRGAFKIDSELQIRARPSMMNPPADVPAPFLSQLDGVMAAYFGVHKTLSRDKVEFARSEARKLLTALGAVKAQLLSGTTKSDWETQAKGLRNHTEALVKAKGLEAVRAQFDGVSKALIAVVRRFGSSGKVPVKRYHCPMAFNNRGAYWLQSNQGVENPYYGSQMYTCGEQVDTLVTGAHKPASHRPAARKPPGHQH